MIPIDDEAREISASYESHWRYKPETSEGSFSQSLVDQFEEAMSNLETKPVEVPGLTELVAAIGKLVETQSPARR